MRTALIAAFVTLSWSAAFAAEPQVMKSELETYKVVTIAEGLKDPWSMAWLPNGDMLLTEKPGRLRVMKNGVMQDEPIAGTPAVRYQGQGGLLEVLPHPDFAKNNLLYISFSKPNADASEGTTAVIRAKLDGNKLTDVKEIFEAKAWSKGGNHYAGKMAWDKDGHLFIVVGDRGVDPLSMPTREHPAQSLMNHQGKVIRLNADGSVPKDNPFVGRKDALPEIWSYGHRNLQGLVIDADNNIWVTEHGPQGGDEFNLALPGKNYGWPIIGYGVQYGGKPIHEARELEGFEQPRQHWTPSIGASGLMIYTGDAFPKWKGHFFAGGLSGKYIARFPVEKTEQGVLQVGRLERPGLLVNYGRVREVRQGPDGFIYVAFDDRSGGTLTQIVRLEPAT